MNIQLAHKIELKPNDAQKGYFARTCGISRFTWNWGLAEWKRQYEDGLKLKKQYPNVKLADEYSYQSTLTFEVK